MKSGWVNKYAVLNVGNPKGPRRGNWNWASIWQIKETVVDREKVLLLKDQKTNKYFKLYPLNKNIM
jgi:hypothetical protein